MSYSLRALGAELIAVVASTIWYIVNILKVARDGTILLGEVAGLGVVAIGISIGVTIVASIIGALIDQNHDTDERDKMIHRRGNAFSGHVLSAGLALGIGYVFYQGFVGGVESISLVHVAHGLMAAGAASSLLGLLVKVGSHVRGH